MTDTDQEPRPPEEASTGTGAPGRLAPPPAQLPLLVEAMLFVSDEPVEPGVLARALGVSTAALGTALNELQAALAGRGIRLQRGPAGVQLITAPEASRAIEDYMGLEIGRRLSNAALETLAIVAYRQPVTRAQIDSIRGVSSEGAVSTLRVRGLIDEAGRSEAPGRPVLFATTQRFLEHFGIERPEDLPPLPNDLTQIPDRQLPLPPAPPADTNSPDTNSPDTNSPDTNSPDTNSPDTQGATLAPDEPAPDLETAAAAPDPSPDAPLAAEATTTA